MPAQATEIIKTLDIDIFKRDAAGALVPDVLKVKYRPVTQAWLDLWAATGRAEAEEAETLLRLATERARADVELAEAEEAQRAEAQAKADAALRAFNDYQAAHPAPAFDFLSRQMADLLIDVGYVDEAGQPVSVTVEFLAKDCDRELLQDIKERIEKKLFRR